MTKSLQAEEVVPRLEETALRWESLLGGMRSAEPSSSSVFPEASVYEASEAGASLGVRFPAGTLSTAAYLSFDVLVEGRNSVVFVLELQEGEKGPAFRHTYFFLNNAGARVRMPLCATDQNRWLIPREGAWLKPMFGGARVDPARVDRLRIVVERKSSEIARFHHTPVRLHASEPPLLEPPPLPRGPLIDALGQSILRDWPVKVRDLPAMIEGLKRQRGSAGTAAWPARWSEWGGCRDLVFDATGYFRIERDGERFWLVAPDGCAFWSAGIDCWRSGNFSTPVSGLEGAFAELPPKAGPYAAAWSSRTSRSAVADTVQTDSVCFHTANLVRAFGEDWQQAWVDLACAGLRQAGFNTVANWSDCQTASRHRLPYVRPLHPYHGTQTACIFRDFPDVFDPSFENDAAAMAAQLEDTKDDPALIGYFLGNEPTWGFAVQTPAEGMLSNTETCRTRDAFAAWLEERHGDDAALAAAWNLPAASLTRIRKGRWHETFSDSAKADCAAFSTVMVARLYDTASRACKAIDPHHLNLGARYYTVPPEWAIGGMTSFDVFSINCYRQEVPEDLAEKLVKPTGRPVMIGEWHFGALDAGLPSSGIGHVPTQTDRGKAFRRYTEKAAALPWCIGVHYFTFYDQSAAGRFDGENYNIGFFDVCNQPYTPFLDAARASHERLYDVARGLVPAFDDAPVYLPLLFC